MICTNCGKPTDTLIGVTEYDEDTLERDVDWCPECVAAAVAEEFTDLDPRES